MFSLILVPLDGSPLAERALDVAREAGDQVDLLLLRVVSPMIASGDHEPVGEAE